jgi:hypothetical protein
MSWKPTTETPDYSDFPIVLVSNHSYNPDKTFVRIRVMSWGDLNDRRTWEAIVNYHNVVGWKSLNLVALAEDVGIDASIYEIGNRNSLDS